MASFKSTSPVGKNHFSLAVCPIVLKYNGIFTHHFSKHTFVNVMKYCKFLLAQKLKIPFEIFIWKLSTRKFHNSPWPSNEWPLLPFGSHSCLWMKKLKQFYKDPGFFPLHWLGWKWGERPLGPMWWVFSFLLCYLTGVAQQSWLFHEQTRLGYYPAVYLGLKGGDCNSISLHDAFIWPSPSPYLEAKTLFWLLDYLIKRFEKETPGTRIIGYFPERHI